MTRHEASGWTRGAIGAAGLFFFLSELSGCGMPPGQFVIIQNQVPSAGCVVPAGTGSPFLGDGELDVRLVLDGAKRGYAAFPLMQNNLPPSGTAADPNRIKLSSFDVDIDVPAGVESGPMFEFIRGIRDTNPNLIHYGILTSGSVASGGGNTSSFVDAVPADLARAIRGSDVLKTVAYADLITTISARGTTDGGRDVRSDPFHYPIRVCDGCLIANLDVCPSTRTPTHLGNACNIAQDQPVDCCVLGKGLVCPPSTMVTAQ